MLAPHPMDRDKPLAERRWVCRRCGYRVFDDSAVAHAHLIEHVPALAGAVVRPINQEPHQ